MPSPVVVGIDGSPESLAAAAWAADEAERRQSPLSLLNAWAVPAAAYPVGVLPETSRRDAAEDLVGRTREDLATRHPGLRIEARAVAERPVTALVDAAAGAGLLAVGSRGLGVIGGFLLGSISSHVVAHAPCPVVAVRAAPPAEATEIVLGLKRTGEPAGALVDFAFGVAARRRLPLHVVHAWPAPTPLVSRHRAVPRDHAGPDDALVRDLAAALAPWCTRHPDVTVRETLEPGNAAEALLGPAAGAELIVVGRRSTRGPRLGGVANALLHHSPAPVAVVPHD
ncbi:universal stress protein [Streptomyces sp. MP131-18]|uniref:universal stress protein n=1 Tax=Streptomyces sp. MP131-18 TaxID=1857892 RepID=UPI00097CACF1|nr:universal stress protein [Streptomyces sp. MP131-18]ONK11650.1 Universal stress protein [Streptomyces sp. MP131-18]